MKKVIVVVFVILISSYYNYTKASLSDTIKTYINSNDSAPSVKKNKFRVSLSGGNNLIQKGKNTAKQQYYQKPKFNYSNKRGIYALVSSTILFGQKKPLDDITVGAGYSKDLFEHLNVDLGYNYSSYYSSTQLTSSSPNEIVFSAYWDWKIITPSFDASYTFGSTNDIAYNLGLTHSFDIDEIFTSDDQLSFPVSIGTSAGTSNFYQAYAKKNPLKKKGGKTTVVPSEINTKFGLTSLYGSVGITYTIKSFSVTFSGTFIKSINVPSGLEIVNKPNFAIALMYAF
jgi:hypothetical protein